MLLPSRGGVYSNLLYLECEFQYMDDDDDEYNSDDDDDDAVIVVVDVT